MGTFYESNTYRDYLSHHGIKNQKWGIQHGPPYPLDSKASSRIKQGKNVSSKDIETAGKSSTNAVRSARNIQQNIRRNRINNKTKDYTSEIQNMSDYDLRKIVNRKTLEQQYNDIRNREEVKIGKDYIGEGLFYAIELTSIAASVATTVAVLNKLSKK